MHVVGPVEHARLADWYRAADLTVLASLSEGIPNVLKESLACGTPFVATSVGGIPELVREPSQIVPPGDPEALAGAIQRRLSSVAASTRPPGQSSWADAASSVAALARSLRENTAPPARNGR
jgi:glycosyltransferase involved in cell wall biosynthesis